MAFRYHRSAAAKSPRLPAPEHSGTSTVGFIALLLYPTKVGQERRGVLVNKNVPHPSWYRVLKTGLRPRRALSSASG